MLNIDLTKKCMAAVTLGIVFSANTFMKPRIVEVEEPMKGVTISEKTIDVNWDKIKEENNFVLLHAGNGLKDDEKFDKYYEQARENGLDVGVFITNDLSTYFNNSPSDITKYAEYRYSHVKISELIGKKISYPVYLRIDYDSPIEVALPKEHAIRLFNRYEMIMTHNKFIPGVYATEEVYNYLRDNIENFDERFAHIIATKEEIKANEMVAELSEDPEVTLLSADFEVPEEEQQEVFDKDKPIKATELSTELEHVTTDKNYNETSRRAIPIILLGMDALTCLGIQLNEKRKKNKHMREKTKVMMLGKSA